MNRDQAEIFGLWALSHMAEHENILTAYLALSGLDPQDLRHMAADPGLLGGVLDFYLQDEKKLMAFCESRNIAPEHLGQARALLPGGAVEADFS